jgi:signal transduction histidine kinase
VKRRLLWIGLPCLLAIVAGGALWFWLRPQALPYHDHFASRQVDEWVPMGGAWQIDQDTVYNRSDERGAKLMTGSDGWADYQLSVETKVIGHDGDVGVVVRAQNAEHGTDSYNGYYVGLRSIDSAVVIGRADYGWMEGRPVAMPGGVVTDIWYGLRVVVVGCSIGAEATNLSTGEKQWAAFEEHPCVEHGRVGLRSMGTGGAWRHVHMERATQADYDAIRAHAAFVQSPIYPKREQDYNHMREVYFRSTYRPGRAPRMVQENTDESVPETVIRQVKPIDEARLGDSSTEDVTVRAVVTLTSPLYVQDSSGGIGVKLAHSAELNVGDEVQFSGHVISDGVMPRFMANVAHLLGERAQVVPVSVTSTQAASGSFDATLVEVRGVLRSKSIDPNGAIHLRLSDDAQTFEAITRSGLSRVSYEQWETGSEMRVRGVCVVRSAEGRRDSAFTLMLRTADDAVVVSGPPWWTGKRVLRLLIAVLVLIVLGVYFFLRLERWKAGAILSERERLAHEMHDTLAQSFAGVGFHLQGMRNSFRSGTQSRETMLEKLNVACSLVAETHRDASASIAALHPEADEGKDLLVALERCTEAMLEANALPIELMREGTPRTMSTPVRDALFQIGREAITNVLRHSQATAMTLRLTYEPKWVLLEVRDNGSGFVYRERAQDFGLGTIRRRCERVGAQMSIITAPGEGTTLSVRAPYGLRLGLGDWLRAMLARFRTHNKA